MDTIEIQELIGRKIIEDIGLNNMSGFNLASKGDGIAHFSNIEVKEIILRNIADTPEDEDKIYDYLKGKYGL